MVSNAYAMGHRLKLSNPDMKTNTINQSYSLISEQNSSTGLEKSSMSGSLCFCYIKCQNDHTIDVKKI